jgi:hypothetical protein
MNFKFHLLFGLAFLILWTGINNNSLFAQRKDDKERKKEKTMEKSGLVVSNSKLRKKDRNSHYNDMDRADYLGTGRDVPTEKRYQGTGKTLTQKIKLPRKHSRRDDAHERADYSGDIKYVDIAGLRQKKDTRMANYSGSIATRKVHARIRDSKDRNKEMADYSGSIRYVDIGKKRERMSAKMSTFKGAVPIRIRQRPKGSIVSGFRGEAKRSAPANYNRKAFKSGRKVKKSDLPNYLKTKPGKVRYDSRETKMWTEGGTTTLPKRADRDAERKKLLKENKAEKKGSKKKKTEDAQPNPERQTEEQDKF